MPEHHAAARTTNSNRGVHPIMRFADVADSTARNAIVQTAADKGGVVHQTGGDTPGYYVADGAGGWARFNTDLNPITLMVSTPYAASILDHIVVLVSGAASITLPPITPDMIGKSIIIANYSSDKVTVTPDSSGAPQVGVIGGAFPGVFVMDGGSPGVVHLMASGDPGLGAYVWLLVSEPRRALDDVSLALSDLDVTDVTTGSTKGYWRTKQAFLLKDLVATLHPGHPTTAADLEINIRVDGGAILTTLLTIDNGAVTSFGGSTPFVFDAGFVTAQQVIPNNSLVEFDVISTGTGARGLQISLLGNYSYSQNT